MVFYTDFEFALKKAMQEIKNQSTKERKELRGTSLLIRVPLAKFWNSAEGMSHSCKMYTMRVAFAVWVFFAVRPEARQGLNTPSLHLLLTIMRQFERNGAYIFIHMCVYIGARICRDRYLGFFSPSEVAIVVAAVRTSIHADVYQGFGRMPRGLFADDFWPRLSVCRASQERLVSCDSAAIVRGMISR